MSRRSSKRAQIGVRVAVRLEDGYFHEGFIEYVSEHSDICGTLYYIGGLKNYPLKHFKAREEVIYGPGFQQVSQSTPLKDGQSVYVTHNGHEVTGHITGRLPKGKVQVSLDTEPEDIIVRCDNLRFIESRKSPRLNAANRVPVKREREPSESIDVPKQKLYFRLGDGEEYTPSPKTPKPDPLALEGSDQDIISAAQALTDMSKSPSSPGYEQKEQEQAFYGVLNTMLNVSSPQSWNDSLRSLGYHSQTSPNASPVTNLSASAPTQDQINMSGTSDDADMFSYFGGELDQPKCSVRRIKYVCTYPRCAVQCESSAAIKLHVRTHLGQPAHRLARRSLSTDENVAEEEFYFDEVEVDEVTTDFSQMRTSTPPGVAQQRATMPEAPPLSPVLAKKFDHDYIAKDSLLTDKPDLLRMTLQPSMFPLPLPASGAPSILPPPSAIFQAVPNAIPFSSAMPLQQQQQHNVQHSPVARSMNPPKPGPAHTPPRRTRDVKKCRKVYGIENRDQWCKDCKWKKACKRFTSANSGNAEVTSPPMSISIPSSLSSPPSQQALPSPPTVPATLVRSVTTTQ